MAQWVCHGDHLQDEWKAREPLACHVSVWLGQEAVQGQQPAWTFTVFTLKRLMRKPYDVLWEKTFR